MLGSAALRRRALRCLGGGGMSGLSTKHSRKATLEHARALPSAARVRDETIQQWGEVCRLVVQNHKDAQKRYSITLEKAEREVADELRHGRSDDDVGFD